MLGNNQKEKPTENFWFGFVLGVCFGGGALFLLGTKKGRKWLKKVIQSAEELESSWEEILEDVGEKIEEKKEIVTPPLSSVLGKIKSVL